MDRCELRGVLCKQYLSTELQECKNRKRKKKGKLNLGKGNEMHFKDLIILKGIKSLSKVINYLKYTTSNTLIIQSCPFASFLRTP